MRQLSLVILFLFASKVLLSQYNNKSEIRLYAGASLPELINAGATYRINKSSMVGGSFGVIPVGGLIWQSANASHRFYFSRQANGKILKNWFTRQGVSFLLPSNEINVLLTVGVDREITENNDGLTFELGAYYTQGKDNPFFRSDQLQIRPVVAIHYYIKYSKRLFTRKKYKNCNAFN